MWSKKEIIIFFAGAQAFHTFSHFFMWAINFPVFQYFSWTITPQFLFLSGIINALITAVLLWWASKI